jgi:hypothetical protein
MNGFESHYHFSLQKAYTSTPWKYKSQVPGQLHIFIFIFTMPINIYGPSVWSVLCYTLLVLEFWGSPQIFGQTVRPYIDMQKL